MANPKMNLTKSFQLWEFMVSVTADRNGIDNTPNAKEIDHLTTLCKTILQPARDALGPLRISSGFRSEKLNDFVGGASNSDHRLGFAADVIPITAGTRQLAEWVVKNVSQFDQVILEFGTVQNPNWIHLSAAPRLRGEILTAARDGGQTVYEDYGGFST
jgi:Peptidase M15